MCILSLNTDHIYLYVPRCVCVCAVASGQQHVRLPSLRGGRERALQPRPAGAPGVGDAPGVRGDERPGHRGHLPQVWLGVPRQGAASDTGDK